MISIVIQKPEQAVIEERPMPQPGPGEARVRTAYCGICATDLVMIAGAHRMPFPFILGHEWSGVIDAVGPGVDTALVGRRCVGDNILACGACAACRAGRAAACARSREVGFELPGGCAQYFLTRATQLRLLPDHLPLDAATLIEPMAVVLHGLARLTSPIRASQPPSAVPAPASAQPGAVVPHLAVLVVGDGPIGLLTVLALRAGGMAAIAVVGGRQQKLALARTFGATDAFSYRMPQVDLEAELRALAPDGFALAVEASGKVSGFDMALGRLAKNSEMLLFGDYGPAHASVPLLQLILREVRITASNCGTGAWDAAVEFFIGHAEMMSRMITHRFAPCRFAEAFDAAERRRDEAIKVLFDWSLL